MHAILVPLLALAQYPGQASKTTDKKATPTLRAISVYEWTGELEKPNACRLIPVMVFDGEKMQDATVYLSRPAPMALASEVEYEIQLNGHVVALFDVQNAALVEGAWVGLGAPKPLPKPKVVKSKKPQIQIDDFGETDKPVLHRKHPAQTTSQATPDSSTNSSATPSAPVDPDRPQLHRKPTTDNSSPSTSTDTTAGTSTNLGTTGTTSSTTIPNDPDRPQLHRPQPKTDASANSIDPIDPDRPRLRHGTMGNFQLDVVPGLKGLPADLDQAVAVSDTVRRLDHPWNFSWANPDDAEKMKAALEQIARDALGMTPPPKPKSKSATKLTHTRPQTPIEPPALGDVNFRAFELAYNSSATLVLTANNGLAGKDLKYVTLIAQPDLYGNPLVFFKQVTDLAQLDTKPRMRLVDAVDALADNRGELLFELRTTDDRQFALYRVLRGSAQQIFVTGGNTSAGNQ